MDYIFYVIFFGIIGAYAGIKLTIVALNTATAFRKGLNGR